MYGESPRFRPVVPYRGRGGPDMPPMGRQVMPPMGHPVMPPGQIPFGEVRNFAPPFPGRGMCIPRPRGCPRRPFRHAGPSYRPPVGNPVNPPDQGTDDKYHWIRADQPTTGNGGTKSGKLDCICYRPRSKIYCMQCDHTSESRRIQRSCPLHPNVFMLMDLTMCPECGASRFWLRENAEE